MARNGSRLEIARLIEQLSNTVDMEELAGRLGISVKKSGASVLAQCIFHNDTNPSMSLFAATSKDKSHYHCFVCNAHGDIYELVKKALGLDFKGAVRWLASSYGLSTSLALDNTVARRPPPVTQESKPTVQIDTVTLERILSIFQSSDKEALQAWATKRNLALSLCVEAELADVRPRTLVTRLAGSSVHYGELRELLGVVEATGLIRSDQKQSVAHDSENYLNLGSQYRDFFNDGRIVFPIRDATSRLVGFAGRKTDDHSLAPKYLYSPGLPKNSLLYRANVAFARIRADASSGTQPVIYVCEGLVDALRFESLGFAAVAVLGARISEGQLRVLSEFAGLLPETQPLQVRFFLDRDGPGLKGAAASIEMALKVDHELRMEFGFVWPSTNRPENSEKNGLKDPDEFLLGFDGAADAATFLEQSTHPVAVALLAERLNVPPTDILDDAKWAAIPTGAKYRLAFLLVQASGGISNRVLDIRTQVTNKSQKWKEDVALYIRTPLTALGGAYGSESPEEAAYRLNLARELAQHGANKGEVLSDIAAWRRISLAATAFNQGLVSRLKQAQFQPLEPFDAVHVSRGFGRTEPRLKAMPCPEDLIVQQYILNELLTERFDDGSPLKFSNSIPAVRYYRALNRLRTTGENATSDNDETLSFAYQIDMDVLEGRRPPGDSGIFRPYFECWKGFISSLLTQGKAMSKVHMIRLDLRRYYDEIQRVIAKDLLLQVLTPAYGRLSDKQAFAPLFKPKNFDHERDRTVIDFLLEQSFGYPYFDPDTGDAKKSKREIGIPQGPVLSAWLGNIVLFKLDSVLRERLLSLNSSGVVKGGYARYVDDVILLGDSVDTLDQLRASAEDVARALKLELTAKESFAPMSNAEFAQHLTSGRAIAASGPRGEATLLESGDGDAGWGMWQTEQPRRQTSLELLRDPRLYTAAPEIIQDQIYTALRAEDLRPAELSKAARWVWYQAAKAFVDEEYTPETILSAYWDIWNAVCTGAPFNLDQSIPWDDPAFYALEGLESLFERANGHDSGLTHEEATERTSCIAKLARVARPLTFVQLFRSVDYDNMPPGWGSGTKRLRRMFFQRIICMRWKAVRLSNGTGDPDHEQVSIQNFIQDLSASLQGSLGRSLVTDSETWKNIVTPVTVIAHGDSDWNFLGTAFVWLHRAVVALGSADLADQSDPLENLRNELRRIEDRSLDSRFAHFSIADDGFLPLLDGLLPAIVSSESDANINDVKGEVVLLALQTLAALTRRETLPGLLSNRSHLLQQGEKKLPLPPLPGVPTKGLLLVSTNDVKDCWTSVSTIWWLTLTSGDDATSPLPTFRVGGAGGEMQTISPQWQSVSVVKQLQMYRAPWAIAGSICNILVQPPTLPINASTLGWVADAFEAIARVNFQEDGLTNAEYVPAWPYLTVNWLPDSRSFSPLKLTLLTPSFPQTLLDGQAFIRDGARGLRAHDVPELYGRHWRAGVLLSDLFGFRRDLDQYAALRTHGVTDTDSADTLDPATHLLRNVLRKLRGTFENERILRAREGREHIPASIARSLDILRGYPKTVGSPIAIAYVLASEAETAAMHARIKNDVALEYRGIAAAFAERVALRVVDRIPLSWSEHLKPIAEERAAITSRIVPQAYLDLANRFAALLPPRTGAELHGIGFSVIVAGLRLAAIAAWLRELNFELQSLGSAEQWPFPDNGDLANEWELEEQGFLFDRPDAPINDLSQFYLQRIADGAPQQAFSNITPLGWLTLFAGRVGLMCGAGLRNLKSPWSVSVVQRLRKLALELAAAVVDGNSDPDDISIDWPFEFDHSEVVNQWLSLDSVEFGTCMREIENNLGLVHRSQVVAPWRLDPSDHTFTDADGQKWAIQLWQLQLGGGIKPERITVGRRLVSVWHETRDESGNLLLVSARDDRLAKLLGPSQFHLAAAFDVDGSTVAALNHIVDMEVKRKRLNDTDPAGSPSHEQLIPAIETDSPRGGAEIVDEGTETPLDDAVIGPDARQRWSALRELSWRRREQRSPGHVRIALMQWDLDETYHHPLTDADQWDKKWPPEIALGSVEASAIERRRRKFIIEALTACEKFEVDLLVLPEYSVRPDTVKWLKDQLQRRSDMPAVLAGTYKLHGNVSDSGFDDVHREILGVADHGKIFGSTSFPDKGSSKLHSSGEHSAMLTLIAPLSLTTGERIACVFSRRKKYPSLAASEVFNPPLEEINPLFSTSSLLEELSSRDVQGLRATPGINVSAPAIIEYTRELRRLEYLAEFVCSELFLPMSPANYQALASELRKLALRFGATISEEKATESVVADVRNMASYLGVADAKGMSKRRSILIVPAMTTRSADYWIFGQAALLAGGATTVFCNAVVHDKFSVGGSCFVGRNSWSAEAKTVHFDAITPYAGWSKGIYYNRKSDALGEREQAVVIADIDPSFMQEGKPRPQALAIPLQLVAHLPIVEVTAERAQGFATDMANGLDELESLGTRGGIIDPALPILSNMNARISDELRGRDDGAFAERFKHLGMYWRANPIAGLPPAIVDWLWVDAPAADSPEVGILIPGCCANAGAPPTDDLTDG